MPYTASDYRFTVGNGAVYAICMKCPEDGKFTVRSLKTYPDHNKPEFQGIIGSVQLLGVGEVAWTADEDGLHVDAPGVKSDWPVVLKVCLR